MIEIKKNSGEAKDKQLSSGMDTVQEGALNK